MFRAGPGFIPALGIGSSSRDLNDPWLGSMGSPVVKPFHHFVELEFSVDQCVSGHPRIPRYALSGKKVDEIVS